MITRRPPGRSARPTVVHELRARAHERDQLRCVDPPPPPSAASISLKHMARPAWRDPGPFVTSVRARTDANVESIGVRRPKVDPVLRREIVEGEESLPVHRSAWLRPSATSRSRGRTPRGQPRHRGVQGGERARRPPRLGEGPSQARLLREIWDAEDRSSRAAIRSRGTRLGRPPRTQAPVAHRRTARASRSPRAIATSEGGPRRNAVRRGRSVSSPALTGSVQEPQV